MSTKIQQITRTDAGLFLLEEKEHTVIIALALKEKGAAMQVNITKTRVRYADTDCMGVVHHARYLEYFEIGRTEYMRERGLPYAQVEKDGTFLVLSEAQVFYRGSAAYDEVLTIKTWVESLTGVRVKFRYEILDEKNAVLAEGHTVLASVDRTGKVKRMPQDVANVLKGDL